MTTTELLDALPTITAIVAIIAPVVSTALTLRSNERVRRLEISAPLMRSATTKLISSYSAISHNREAADDLGLDAAIADFRPACYELALLVPNRTLQRRIFAFPDAVVANRLICPEEEKDEFQAILSAVSVYTTVSRQKYSFRR